MSPFMGACPSTTLVRENGGDFLSEGRVRNVLTSPAVVVQKDTKCIAQFSRLIPRQMENDCFAFLVRRRILNTHVHVTHASDPHPTGRSQKSDYRSPHWTAVAQGNVIDS
jgi:hypothetical protein